MILLIGTVNALGITPARTAINFEPNLEKEIVLTVINSEKKASEISIVVDGPLKDYIKINETKFKFNLGESERLISYKIKLPEGLDSFGAHGTDILINELPEDTKGELVIGALISVVSEVNVFVPYPEKYADVAFNIYTEEGKAKLHLLVRNFGEEEFDLNSTIIITKDGQEVLRKDYNLGRIKKFGLGEVLEEFKGESGDYEAKVIVSYGEIIEESKSFSLENIVEAVGIAVNEEFSLGEIAKFTILLENKENKAVKDVVARLILKDNAGKTISDEISLGLVLEPNSQGVVRLFWDTTGLNVGKYTGVLTLGYNGKVIERPVVIELFNDKIEAKFGITGFAVVNNEKPKTDKVVLIPLLIIVILVINIVWYVIYKRKKR